MSDHTLQRIQGTIITVLGVLLTVFFLSGCVAQNKETTKPSESETQMTGAQDGVSESRYLKSVTLAQNNGNLQVLIKADKKLTYTSIKQDFPFGIAIYLPDTSISNSFQKTVAENSSISDILVGYAGEDKLTVKLEILLKENLSYEIVENQDALVVSLNGDASLEKPAPSGGEDTAMANDAIQSPKNDNGSQNLVIPDKTATMENIEFNTMEDGNSDIVVKTDHPVKYDISQKGYDTIYLNLHNTIIPDYHKRPLLTQYFKSAVESLMPVQLPGKEKNSAIEIKIRQAVPYRVVQNKNQISLFFEPSTITPPVFEKARKKLNDKTQVEAASADVQTMSNQMMTKSQEPDMSKKSVQSEKITETDEESFLGKKQYTGEKIKLDFYETDIKNVFRILKSVGGSNFAIDKDVDGKVTLSFEDPVPWDQVLDLVLKMNDLGQKKEGNVIRIAKLEKLKKEEQLIQEAIAARKKTIADNKALEPLVTEYVPINYSDANTDIKPHIEKILTKERGKISVDTRTNMIILTDTQEKIDQAKEIIYRLDKVTPQIMIEAKVVEVTKDFSRELGMGLTFNRTQTAPTGNSEDFSVALNYPTSAPANDLSFNFYRLLGAQFLNLKAQLAASESKGDIKVVSSPRILTLDNKKAKIKQGLEYAYLERDDSGGSSVKFKNIDLLLEVTPHVTPDKRIAMTVYLTKNDIDTVTNGVPSLSTNEAETELLVNNNDTVVIGGIVKTTDNKSTSGTPVLSGIPIIGRLFRTDIDKDKRNELLIFLTPSIVQLEQKKNTFTTNN